MGADRLAELELEARREAALQAVTAELSAAATRAQILNAILEEGSRVLASSAAGAYLLSDDGASLSLVARRGVADEIARTLDGLPLTSNYPVARSVREGQPVWVSSQQSLARDFPEFERAMSGAFERQAVVALPLRVNGQIVGGLGFAFPEEHPFDKGERAFMMTLAARCEAAMDRARLYEESQQARAAAEQSRAEAEALLRFNEVVAGILAHDLKNPLAAILMNARLLRDVDAARARTVGTRIVTSGERMSRMIDQILEWTRLRAAAGWVHLSRTACDLGVVTDEVVAELRGRKADVPIVVEARGDLRGSWDADRLAQVISNLGGNALDHASSPGVRFTLDGTGADVRLAVRNEGVIEDELLPVMFEPFRGRAAGAKTRGRGLGLGLYITRQIVLAHGGSVDIERGPDATVTFVVTLPRTSD
ncbi:MAG TPA: HAMP domain-containing sensor histidine kinase [Polyangia bacterium]|jgi:signal transduction histidine kinase|nr:HAMP domain-containing sensor histidine kinase [Polyangia bacterium]